MQQNKTSDLSESMTEAIDTFVLEFLDFFMSYMGKIGPELSIYDKSLQELWLTMWSKEQKQSLITSTREYGKNTSQSQTW